MSFDKTVVPEAEIPLVQSVSNENILQKKTSDSNIKNTISDTCSDDIIDSDNSITNSDNYAFIDSSEDESNESNFFVKALNNIQKIDDPDKLNHTLGFEEKKITNNEDNGLNSFLLKDKTDKLISEKKTNNPHVVFGKIIYYRLHELIDNP